MGKKNLYVIEYKQRLTDVSNNKSCLQEKLKRIQGQIKFLSGQCQLLDTDLTQSCSFQKKIY